VRPELMQGAKLKFSLYRAEALPDHV
jgi:hypothetical protein